MPATLLPYWKRTAASEFPGLPTSATFYARALEGLLNFFECVRLAGVPCTLPSRAADSVWHAWLALDPAGLRRFCLRHYGQAIPHHPAGTMPGDPDVALAACLVAARRHQGQAPAGLALPLLFKLDEALRMPLGYSHAPTRQRIRCGKLDRRGRPCGPHRYPECLTPLDLLQARLVSQEEYAQATRRAAANDSLSEPDLFWANSDARGSDDGDCGDGGGDGGDACGDSGGDGGGGDGGGDGGGCGGGCGGGGGD